MEEDWLARLEGLAKEQNDLREEKERQTRERGDQERDSFDRFTEGFKQNVLPGLASLGAKMAAHGFQLQVHALESDGIKLVQRFVASGGNKSGSGEVQLVANRGQHQASVTLTAKRSAQAGEAEVASVSVDIKDVTPDFIEECLDVVMTSYLLGGLKANVSKKDWKGPGSRK